MANPIAHIGVPGTSSYKVDWGPRQRGQEQMWKGIGQLVNSVAEQQRQSAEKKSLAEVMAFLLIRETPPVGMYVLNMFRMRGSRLWGSRLHRACVV